MGKRIRIYRRQYELARICVPQDVADIIESKSTAMRNCQCRNIYLELKEQRDTAHSYDERQRLEYLTELFWVLQGETPIMLKRMGEAECVPTDYLERDSYTLGHRKVQQCKVLSLCVHLDKDQEESVEQMMAIVERKMRSFKTDFLFHDMKRFSRVLCRKPVLWVVGTSHTFEEVIESEEWAQHLQNYLDAEDVQRFLYQGEDETWVGAALRVACDEEDEFYYHDGSVLHKISRKRFQEIHDRYLQRVRDIVKEAIGRKAA